MINQIKKRDGEIVNYDDSKISVAITKASDEVGVGIPTSVMKTLMDIVYSRLCEQDGVVSVEDVQDHVEDALLDFGYPKVAKAYIKYRERQKIRRESDIFERRLMMKPYEYPQLMDYGDAIRNSYWVVTEYNFTQDIQNFRSDIKPYERDAISRSMLAISQVEVAVKTFWGDLYHKMPKYEVGAVGAVFSESEARHAEAYSHLLEILGLNEEFNKIKDIPALMERVDYLSKASAWAKTGNKRDFALSLTLFSLFIEHVSLFSQFLIMMSFNKHKNLFSGLSNTIEATSKEEQIHGLFGIELVNIIREENPDWFDEDMEKEIYELCQLSFESEKKVVDWIFESGELDFLPKYDVLEFIKNRMNNSLVSVGYEKLFEVDEEAISRTRWFDDEIIGTKLTDFFAKRSVNYNKFSNSITKDTIFSPTSDLTASKNTTKNDINILMRTRMMTLNN